MQGPLALRGCSPPAEQLAGGLRPEQRRGAGPEPGRGRSMFKQQKNPRISCPPQTFNAMHGGGAKWSLGRSSHRANPSSGDNEKQQQ